MTPTDTIPKPIDAAPKPFVRAPGYYVHIRSHARAKAFAIVGPYPSKEWAVEAARFAKAPHWTVYRREAADQLQLAEADAAA